MLSNTLQNYYLYRIDKNFDANEELKIIQKIQESNLVIIDQFLYEGQNDIYLVIGFHETIIIINDSSINLLKHLFANNAQLKFYFLNNSKSIFDKSNTIADEQIFQYSEKFDDEIINFNTFFEIGHPKQMQNRINSCISGYLIGESYFKLINEQKIDFSTAFKIDTNQKEREKSNIKEWIKNDYIKLRQIGIGSFFEAELIYQIVTGRLLVVKKPHLEDKEIPKLYKRECKIYLEINYPLIPKYYGTQRGNNCLIIQYIHGQTLNKIDITKLELEDKITIIVELILIIKYLHDNKFVYRDLKPNNVILDQNKTVFLIDFDRMISINSPGEFENFTKDFQSGYIAPEVFNGNISYKNDIYSLGKMIRYLQLEKDSDKIHSLYLKCIKSIDQRPYILELLMQFVLIFIQHLSKSLIVLNFPEIQYLQGKIYYEGKYIKRDINESIHYYSLAANQNHSNAQFNLGLIYYKGKYIKRNVNKGIHYLSLAADQNHTNAQFNLGLIYYEGKYIKRDINKSIHYLLLAADQNHLDAQFNLGLIYYEGKYIKRDIDKSIHFLSLAADQNHAKAQFNLGEIYYNGKYIEKDVNKGIHYLSLAVNQLHPIQQLNSNVVYYEGKYINRIIYDLLSFFLPDSNHKIDLKESIFGFIYANQLIESDINKAILLLSSNEYKNYPYSQFKLGEIFYKGKYIERDI